MSRWTKKDGYESEEDFFRVLRWIPKPLRIFWSKRRLEKFYRWEAQQIRKKEQDKIRKTKENIKKSKDFVSFTTNPKTKEKEQQLKKSLEKIRNLQNQQSKEKQKSCEQDFEM